jgi:TIR domain
VALGSATSTANLTSVVNRRLTTWPQRPVAVTVRFSGAGLSAAFFAGAFFGAALVAVIFLAAALRREELTQRVADAIAAQDSREWDIFLSYAQIDGAEVGGELCAHLQNLGVRVWFHEVVLQPGVSQARQMDRGLAKAHCGVALLTPAYVAGRFWTERELGALLDKSTLIPVLHGVVFNQVAEHSGILPDLVGFETAKHSLAEIADKITEAVLRPKAV